MHHTLKVVPNTAFEVNVVCDNTDYKTRGALIQPIEWRRVTNKAEVKVIMLQWNKQNLQQTTSEYSPPSMNYLQKVTEKFRASLLADKLLDGKITN